MSPQVSVVMTSYNHEKYLQQAIQSVVNQSYTDFELIIVDDCSNDNSREIINKNEDQYNFIKSIYHETNRGVAKTINDGRYQAKGDYIAHIASDDVWTTKKLERQMMILDEKPNTLVWSDGAIIDSNGISSGKTFIEKHSAVDRKKSGNVFSELLKGNMIFGSSCIYNSDIVGRIDYDESLRYLNDFKYWLQLAEIYNFVFIPSCLAKYRLHNNNSSLTRDFEKRNAKENLRIYRDLLADHTLTIKQKIYIYYKIVEIISSRGKRIFWNI